MRNLIRDYFVPAFDLKSLNDSAVIEGKFQGRVAVTTDSYVISPLFFPGGDIGTLSICGTVNDLSVAGARPVVLTAGFIIEEGFPLEELRTILQSMRRTADKSAVQIVAGDTKVVDKGKGDGIFINTAGFGIVEYGLELSPRNIRPGDKIIISGSIGNHGMAVMARRNGIHFEPEILSDVAPLNKLVELMLKASRNIRVMRDPTRGGVATTLKEFADESGLCMAVEEKAFEIKSGVRGACDLLGLDPLYVANEGILLAVVGAEDAAKVVGEMRSTEEGSGAAVIGEVAQGPAQAVLLKTNIGGIRIVDMLSGDQLPRIC